jgi:hypothetical protein
METYPAIHTPQQMAQTNMLDPTSWLRVVNKLGEDAQMGLALFIYTPVETSRSACLLVEIVRFEVWLQYRETASAIAAMDGIFTTKVSATRDLGRTVLVVTKGRSQAPGDRTLLASWAILLRDSTSRFAFGRRQTDRPQCCLALLKATRQSKQPFPNTCTLELTASLCKPAKYV